MTVCSKRGALSGRGRKLCEVDQGAARFGACGAGCSGTTCGEIAAEGVFKWENDGGGIEDDERAWDLTCVGRRSALRNIVVQVKIDNSNRNGHADLTPRQ
jgi:hypothetical protein